VSDSRADDADLPWLQEVEDEDAPRGISARAMLIGFLIVLVLAAVVAGSFFWLGKREAGPAGAPELIRAPATPYKVKPENPGGLDVTGESQTTFETSAGQDVDSRLNVPGEDEKVTTTPEEQPKRIPPNETKKPVPAEEPAPPPKPSGAAGSVIQLGAYKNVAQAERAWTALSTRFGLLSGLTKTIVPYSAGGSSGYRLRAAASSPDAARAACQAIQAGGESCFIAR
jgi:cell division protein FtsN